MSVALLPAQVIYIQGDATPVCADMPPVLYRLCPAIHRAVGAHPGTFTAHMHLVVLLALAVEIKENTGCLTLQAQ